MRSDHHTPSHPGGDHTERFLLAVPQQHGPAGPPGRARAGGRADPGTTRACGHQRPRSRLGRAGIADHPRSVHLYPRTSMIHPGLSRVVTESSSSLTSLARAAFGVLAASSAVGGTSPCLLSACRLHRVAADGMISVWWAYGPSRGVFGGERRTSAHYPCCVTSRRYHMTSQEKKIVTAVPDLRDFPLDRLAELGGTPLAHSIALYRERLKENGVPLSSFNARI